MVRLIGKMVLWDMLPEGARARVLEGARPLGRYLRLELALCDEPSLVGAAGHLEIVGRRPEE